MAAKSSLTRENASTEADAEAVAGVATEFGKRAAAGAKYGSGSVLTAMEGAVKNS